MSAENDKPKHVGLIMDGNGRWAEERFLPRTEGHNKGIINMLQLAEYAFELGAQNFVCYSLSTENLNREQNELKHILSLVIKYANQFIELCEKCKIAVKYIGQLQLLPQEIQSSLKQTQKTLSKFEGMGRTIYIAIAYGSRQELVSALNTAIESERKVTEESLLQMLDFPYNFDLIIRTGGEQRLSNFFLYQASYAELYFSNKYFPDFTKEDLSSAFEWYKTRKRRYGRVEDN